MNNSLRGIGLLLVALLMFSTSDALGKHLIETLPAIEIGWLRYLVFVGVAVAMQLGGGRRHLWLRTHHPRLQFCRGLGMTVSAVCFNLSTHYLPLADATAIAFLSPILITVLSVPFLHEKVGLRRWLVVAAGMIGVLVVIRPGTSAFQPAALITLTSSLGWSSAVILTRKLAGERNSTTMLWSGLTGFVVISALLPFDFRVPSAFQVAEGLAIGLFSSGAHYLTVLAYRRAQASVLAPISYLQLLYSGFYGWLLFGGIPDTMTLTGVGIIMASGFYNASRERRRRS